MMSSHWRRLGEPAILSVALLVGCTNPAVDKAVGTTVGATGLVVSKSDTAIVVENGVGRPLLNVQATIEGDPGGVFIHLLPTLGLRQKADLRFSDFRTEDGTLFDPAVVRATEIKVTARDTLANSYDITSAWDR